MKNKTLKLILISLCSILFFCMMAAPCGAAITEVGEIKNDILSYNITKSGASSKEAWLKDYFPTCISIDAEWYAMCLSKNGENDLTAYKNALESYVQEKEINSASTREKFALSLLAVGSKSEYISDTLNNSLGEQGIMSYVFGLHLLNNGVVHSDFTVSDVIEKIISLQLQNGGWAVRGDVFDVDVTAMTIQALAPYYNIYDDVTESVDSAIAILSSKQLERGDFSSYGVSNPESASQVIIALCSLNIDPFTDERFIKNGNTLLDGILKFRLSDGSFSHVENGESNVNATAQVFSAVTAYEQFLLGKGGFYHFSVSDVSQNYSSVQIEETINTVDEESVSQKGDSNDKTEKSIPIKIIISLFVFFTCLIICLIFYFSGKRNYKNFVVLISLSLVIIVFVFTVDIKSSEEYYNSAELSKENVIGTVTISIDCKTLVGSTDESYIPSDGVILCETAFKIEEGDTVYDILIEAARKHSIQIDNNGNEEMAYIAGINNIYQFQFGDLSGWMFYVNGVESSVGCSSHVLSDGDIIQWRYTLDMGKDIEN